MYVCKYVQKAALENAWMENPRVQCACPPNHGYHICIPQKKKRKEKKKRKKEKKNPCICRFIGVPNLDEFHQLQHGAAAAAAAAAAGTGCPEIAAHTHNNTLQYIPTLDTYIPCTLSAVQENLMICRLDARCPSHVSPTTIPPPCLRGPVLGFAAHGDALAWVTSPKVCLCDPVVMSAKTVKPPGQARAKPPPPRRKKK